MKTTMLVLFGSLALATGGTAQRLSPSVLAAGGGSARTATMSLDWTLGESVVETAKLPDRIYTQGFHQPTLQVTEQVSSANPLLTVDEYLIQIAPNPVQAILNVRIKAYDGSVVDKMDEKVQLQLTDMTGKVLQVREAFLLDDPIQVNMVALPAGMYLLSVQKTAGTPIKTFKVLKD